MIKAVTMAGTTSQVNPVLCHLYKMAKDDEVPESVSVQKKITKLISNSFRNSF